MSVGAEIARDICTEHTEITIKIRVPMRDELDCPMPPRHATFGDDWICLQDHDVLEELGYWEIEQEGLAMCLLRYAWILAHAEHRATHAPFDGDPSRSWDKG